MADENVGQTKVCTKCGAAKLATSDFFSRHKLGKSGLRPQCKACINAAEAVRRETPEAKQRQRAWKAANRDRVSASNAKYASGRGREFQRDYRKTHKEALRLHKLAYRAANREKIREWQRAYRAKNLEAARGYASAYQRRMFAAAGPKAFSSRVSVLIRSSIRSRLAGSRGCRSWHAVLGYTTEELMRHIERQFQRGMSWSNHGRNGWHIDHIIPVVSFMFSSTDDPEFRACWALSNLRPLWAGENINKSAKRLTLGMA